jgi:hypothetical protein
MRQALAILLIGGLAAPTLATAAAAWTPDDGATMRWPVFEQRQDVEEISTPPLPTGPASPPPSCMPSNPIC